MHILNYLPVTFLLLWKPVLSAPEALECCYCGTLDLKTNTGLKPNVKPSPFKILVQEKQYTAGGNRINGMYMYIYKISVTKDKKVKACV